MEKNSQAKRGLNSYLIALALACLLPVVAVSAVAVWSAGSAYRDAAVARLNDTARTLANAIEGELSSRFANMSVLAQHREIPDPEPLPEPELWVLGADNNVALIANDRVPALRARSNAADCLVRLGGDEFAVIQNDSRQPDASVSLGCRIVEALCAPYDIGGHQISIGASVGVTLIGNDSSDIGTYFKRADAALYRAKQDGRGRVCFFDQVELLADMVELAKGGSVQAKDVAERSNGRA